MGLCETSLAVASMAWFLHRLLRNNLSSRFALMRLATGQPPSTRDAGTSRVVTVPLNSRDVLGSDWSVTVGSPSAALRDLSPRGA